MTEERPVPEGGPRVVVLTGAGISAESGVPTFRDAGGLWEGHRVEDVATPEAFERDPETVQRFYDARRRAVASVAPNPAHVALARLETELGDDLLVVTQNIDDLHERAGSRKVLHLHGEILKSRSTLDPTLIYPIRGSEIRLGDKCEKGSQLRPHIVWFGEMVPMMDQACLIAEKAEIFLVVGTSMAVYPAAGLIDHTPVQIPKYLIDPGEVKVNGIGNLKIIREKASTGLPALVKELLGN